MVRCARPVAAADISAVENGMAAKVGMSARSVSGSVVSGVSWKGTGVMSTAKCLSAAIVGNHCGVWGRFGRSGRYL